jgi:CxxC-x17-CxxC domain-containing protein
MRNFNRGGSSDGPRRSFNRFRSFDGPREMHKAVCSECKQECEVPFKPTEGRPVFCKDCFMKQKGIKPRREEKSESKDSEESEETEEFEDEEANEKESESEED